MGHLAPNLQSIEERCEPEVMERFMRHLLLEKLGEGRLSVNQAIG